jgi:hypothetical protein
MSSLQRVSVIGSGEYIAELANQAMRLGQLLAMQGYTIVCGGLGGVMEAVCQGAVSEGGLTIGVLPGLKTSQANPYVKIPIATGLGHHRNYLVVLNGDVVIALSGGYGTLSEIALARKINKTVLVMGKWDTLSGVIPVHSPEDALKFLTSNK